jgi:hypothetical protein
LHRGFVQVRQFFPGPLLEDELLKVYDSTPRRGDVREHLNHVLMPDHVATIKAYLEQNRGDYILPGLTLNAAADVEILQIGEPIGA